MKKKINCCTLQPSVGTDQYVCKDFFIGISVALITMFALYGFREY